jgi:hypothetical protein
VLHTSCNDQNVLNRIPELTDEELRYCLLKEKRKTRVRNLLRKAKKRHFPITKPPETPEEQFLLYDDETEVLKLALSGFNDDQLSFITQKETREHVKELIKTEKEFRDELKNISLEPVQLPLF